jgi:hypothetical protein
MRTALRSSSSHLRSLVVREAFGPSEHALSDGSVLPLSRSDKASISSSRSSIAGWLLTNISPVASRLIGLSIAGPTPSDIVLSSANTFSRFKARASGRSITPSSLARSSLMTFASWASRAISNARSMSASGAPANPNPRLFPDWVSSAGSLRFTETSLAMRRSALFRPCWVSSNRLPNRPSADAASQRDHRGDKPLQPCC